MASDGKLTEDESSIILDQTLHQNGSAGCRPKSKVRRDTPFSNPIYKQISLRNGEINKMTKEKIQEKLAELRLGTRGVKEVLKKRLKNYYKRQKLLKANFKYHSEADMFYDYILVIDFEATCNEVNIPGFNFEVIEFPVVMICMTEMRVVHTFHSYCRPTLNPKLSSFCIHLTGITQSVVNNAPLFTEVMSQLEDWMQTVGLKDKGVKFAVATDGPWDMSRFLYQQCHLSNVPFPKWGRKWINVRKAFGNCYSVRQVKLTTMLEYLGMEFEGEQHRGIDDAKNIARILLCMLKDGCELRINERLFAKKAQHVSGDDKNVVSVSKSEAEQDLATELDTEWTDSTGTDIKGLSTSRSDSASSHDKKQSVDIITGISELSLGQSLGHSDDGDNIEDLIAYHNIQQGQF
ncbi:3'-5' exoribonuclease 1 [Lingula anatina]|uniref:3'-5' exoribonuclease 1 n=1 Tax=Lingula anatina TaxID=7574 RepID=A0A1S3IYI9_LINAN|nr:3'-5' exoribonuclease 1 [Lingula anatina]|eukprot:XP_013402614.1 3'-5' exoribonuclease 1 [Lingula anatina]